MTDNYIQLNKKEELRLKIKTSEGELTGEELVFDLNDIELPLIYQEMIYKIQKNKEKLHNDFVVIDKREDITGKKALSKNEEDKLKAYKEYLNKMTEAYDMFLGENGVKKILNGRKLGWTTLDEIDEIIEKQISPQVLKSFNNIAERIINKYSTSDKEELK